MDKALSITKHGFCAGVGIHADGNTIMLHGVFTKKYSRCRYRKQQQFPSF